MAEQEAEYVSITKAAKRLGVSRDAFKSWVKQGRIPIPLYRTPGGHIRIRTEDIPKVFSRDGRTGNV